MNKKQMREELFICLKEQGHYMTLWGDICFYLHSVMLIEEILKDSYSKQETNNAS